MKFADDTKIGQTVDSLAGVEKLQAALTELCKWAEDWGMAFNVKKCKVMHFGHNNPGSIYTMNGLALEETKEEKDVGVTVSNNLKPAAHCARAARTARAVLGQIARAFHYRDRHVFVRLYVQYVRPHLEFSTPVWSPWSAGDKEVLEKVQKKAVGMVSGLRSAVYEERLKELGLHTLEERRHQADMCMVHRVVHRDAGLEPATWFEGAGASGRATRVASDPLNLRVTAGRLEIIRNFFSVRVPDDWNKVLPNIKRLEKNSAFKKAYSGHRKKLPADE